jgi:hypothetical protein
MSKKIRHPVRIVAALFLTIGCIGWFGGALISLGLSSRIPDSFELPLGDLKGIAVDTQGNVYCGLQFYSRVQLYDAKGRYIYGKFIDSAGGAFRIRMNQSDQLEVATVRNDKLYVFEKDGTLVSELSDARHHFSDFGKAGERRCHDKKHNTTYLVRWSPLGSYIAKEGSSGEETIVIRTAFHKWLFMGPFPAWLFLMAGIVLMWVSGDPLKRRPWKHLLTRRKGIDRL